MISLVSHGPGGFGDAGGNKATKPAGRVNVEQHPSTPDEPKVTYVGLASYMELAAKMLLVDLQVIVVRTDTYVEGITFMELAMKVVLGSPKFTYVANVTSVEFAVHVMLIMPSVPHVQMLAYADFITYADFTNLSSPSWLKC